MKLSFSLFSKNWFYYLVSSLIFAAICFSLFRNYLQIGYIPHDYNMFRDYHDFLNPWTGSRWQPITYFFDHLAVVTFKLHLFWPKTIILLIFYSNFILGLWLINLITKNKLISFFVVLLFVIYSRGSAIALIFTAGSIVGVFVFLFLSSLISYFYFIQKRKWYLLLLTIALWSLSLLGYEAAIVLPFLLLLMEIYFTESFSFKKATISLLPFALVAIGFLFITFRTAVPMSKNQLSSSRFQRAEYYLASFSDVTLHYNYFFIAHLPFVTENSLVSVSNHHLITLKPFNTYSKNLGFFIGILLFSLVILFLKIPKHSKFFLLSVLVIILPFSIFNGSGGLDERYFYLSGLFFIAFILSLFWFLFWSHWLGKICFLLLVLFLGWKNLEILLLKINQWEIAGIMNQNLSAQISANKSMLNSTPIFIENFPYTTYNLGNSYNEIYFLNDQVAPLHIFISPESQEQAIFDYLRIAKCQPDILLNRKAIGWDYQNGKFVDFDIVGLAQKSAINTDSIDCSQ